MLPIRLHGFVDPLRRSVRWHRFWIALCVVVASLLTAAAVLPATGAVIQVSVDDQRGMVPTLDAALVAARSFRRQRPHSTIVITLPSGPIALAEPLRLAAADSGAEGAPLVLRGASDGSTTLTGASVAARASQSIRFALAERFAFRPYASGGTAPELPLIFQGNRRLALSSWPERGYATGWHARIADGSAELSNDKSLPELRGSPWVEGYFSQDWLFEAVAARVLPGRLRIAAPWDGAAAVRSNARLRIVNDPALLGQGRFVVAADGGSVEARPFASDDRPIELAVADGLLSLDNASHVRIENLALVKVRRTAVVVRGGTDIVFSDCRIGLAGFRAIDVRQSRDVRLERCVLEETGESAAFLDAGDRTNLIPANLSIVDSVVRNAAQTLRTAPAVVLWGVGNSVVGSALGSLPGPAVSLQGNDHRVVGNQISAAVCEMGDAGAIYMGRDWTQRGIRIERNFIHDIGDAIGRFLVSGVYLDDQFSGAVVADNVFLRMVFGVFIGGGRDNRIDRNVFAQMRNSAVYLDSRGTTWQKALAGPGGLLRQPLSQLPVDGATWRRRYPEVAGLLDNRPGEPIDNTARGNRYIDSQLAWTEPSGLLLPGTGAGFPVLDARQRAVLDGSAPAAGRMLDGLVGGRAAATPWPERGPGGGPLDIQERCRD